MKKLFIILLLLIVTIIYTFCQENEFDRGIVIKGSEDVSDWEKLIEKKFINTETKFELYYCGAWYRGRGIFWVIIDGNKVSVLETGIRYGPIVKWHGGYIAEIFIPTGSPNRHSFFYNFRNNTLSPQINFPIYYDVSNDFIIGITDEGLDLYDLNNMIIKGNYNFEENIPLLYLLVFGTYELKIEDKFLLFNFKIKTSDIDLEREYIFDYY